MRKENLEVMKQRVLDILPICQSEIWKCGKIPGIKDRRDCSRLMKVLELEGLIKRTKFHDKDKNITTYKVEKLNGSKLLLSSGKLINKNENNKKRGYELLLGKDGKFAPCCGCVIAEKDVCNAVTCNKLTEWLV